MRYIDSLSREELQGKRVLLRTDFNVDIADGAVVDDFRIRQTLPTINFLRENGAHITIISHIGRDPHETLESVATHLKTLGIQTVFAANVQRESLDISDGTVVLRENLRKDPREQGNDATFAQELVSGFDLFVQDAFAVCHREHTSIVGVPKFLPSYGGLLLKAEISALSRVFSPEQPSLAILGGAKFETKEPLIKKLLSTFSYVFVGGALANELIAARGDEVGTSVVEDGKVVSEILHAENLLPIHDVIVLDTTGNVRAAAVHDVHHDEKIVDIGPETMQAVVALVPSCRTVVWNGPMGWYEKGFTAGSLALASAVRDANNTKEGICREHVVIGGGDTVALLDKDVQSACTFVSTGGGAMLVYLLNETLPGIAVIS